MHLSIILLLGVGVVLVATQNSTTQPPTASPGTPASCPAECLLPLERGGRGKKPFTRYYFNGVHCTKFRYTGRNGNANKFIKKAECQATCERSSCGDQGDKDPSKEEENDNSDETGV